MPALTNCAKKKVIKTKLPPTPQCVQEMERQKFNKKTNFRFWLLWSFIHYTDLEIF